MRIGLFTDSFTPEINGVVSSVVMLREGLIDRGHDVWIFAPKNPAAAEDDRVIQVPSMPLAVLPDYRMATPVWPSVTAKINDLKLDLVHTHTEFAVGRFGRKAAQRLNIPRVHTNHTVWEEYTHYLAPTFLDPQARSIVRAATRYVCAGAERIIAPTEKTRLLLTGYGVEQHIDIVPTGVDLARFSPVDEDGLPRLEQLKRSLGIDGFRRILLILGRVAPEKSVIELLEMTTPFLREHRDVAVLVVGGGPSLSDLEALARASGITDQVIFTGPIPWTEIPDMYRISDVLIGNSHTETQGLTFIEALASGTPIVVRHNECFDGVIENGVSGALFRHQAQFLPGLDAVLDPGETRSSRIAEGLQAASTMSKEHFAEQVEAVYQRALDR